MEEAAIKPIRILNLGAGVQSSTVALMGVQNWHYWLCTEPLPYEPVGLIDYAIFADTQEEPGAVYRHLEWLKAKCEKFFPVLVRTAGKLGDDLIKGIPIRNKGPVFNETRFVSIPAFLAQQEGQKDGIIPRQCTSDYKVAVIERTIRREILQLKPGHRVPAGTEVIQMMGLSYDEGGRIMRVRAVKAGSPFELTFPLFEMEMTRGSCKTWLSKQNIPHEVPRSACVFCPYHTNSEWRRIKEDPQDWARAVEVDYGLRDTRIRVMRDRKRTAYLHSDCVPLDQVDLDDPELKERKKGQEMFGFLAECDGMCGV
jgi:hypothetical protein